LGGGLAVGAGSVVGSSVAAILVEAAGGGTMAAFALDGAAVFPSDVTAGTGGLAAGGLRTRLRGAGAGAGAWPSGPGVPDVVVEAVVEVVVAAAA
jgi:hypothetical protein